METEHIVNKIIEFQNQILKNKKINIEYNQFADTIDDIVKDMISEDIEEDYHIKLNSKNLEYIDAFTARISWTYSSDTGFYYGGFQFQDLWQALVAKSNFWKVDFSLAPDVEVPDNLKYFEQINWFEQQLWCDDWRFGCFIREEGIFPPQIAFFDKNWFTPINLSFEEYIKAMIDSCAIAGWQYFYVDFNQDIPHFDKALEDMEKAVEILPILFPNMDFDYHKNRLREIKQKFKC